MEVKLVSEIDGRDFRRCIGDDDNERTFGPNELAVINHFRGNIRVLGIYDNRVSADRALKYYKRKEQRKNPR